MKIEKNIPMPKAREWDTGKKIYFFDEMEVGDSAFFEGQTASGAIGRNSAYTVAQQYAKKSGKKFSGSTNPEGVRIWRVA